MAAETPRRIVVAKRGGPDTLGVVEEPVPRPDAGQVRVSVLLRASRGWT